MKLPEALRALNWVQIHEQRAHRHTLEVAGMAGWCECYPDAICLALDTRLVQSDIDWLHKICLWFASLRECINDCLLLESERLYLLRRYDPQLDSDQWEIALQQQMSVVDWLIKQNSAHDFTTSV